MCVWGGGCLLTEILSNVQQDSGGSSVELVEEGRQAEDEERRHAESIRSEGQAPRNGGERGRLVVVAVVPEVGELGALAVAVRRTAAVILHHLLLTRRRAKSPIGEPSESPTLKEERRRRGKKKNSPPTVTGSSAELQAARGGSSLGLPRCARSGSPDAALCGLLQESILLLLGQLSVFFPPFFLWRGVRLLDVERERRRADCTVKKF